MDEQKLAFPVSILRKNAQFDPSKYLTDHRDYQTWIDLIYNRLIDKLAITPIGVSVGIGILVYLGGLCFALLWGFQDTYISSIAIYLGAFGIPWVMWAIHFASKKVHPSFAQLRLCVLMTDEEYKASLDKYFEILCRPQNKYFFFGGTIIAAIVTPCIVILGSDFFYSLGIRATRPSVFPHEWFANEYRLPSMIILAYYGILIYLPLLTTFRLFWMAYGLLKFMRGLELIPEPEIARHQLNGVNDLFVFTTFTWFIGVALFGILFFQTIDLLSIVIVLSLSAYGLSLFSSSQFTFRNLLANAYDRKVEYYVLIYLKYTGAIDLMQIGATTFRLPGLQDDIEQEVVKKIKKPQLWSFDYSNILALVIGQAIAILSPAIEQAINRIVHFPF